MHKKIKIKRNICGDAAQYQYLYRVYRNHKLLITAITLPSFIYTYEDTVINIVEMMIPFYHPDDDLVMHLIATIICDYKDSGLSYLAIRENLTFRYPSIESMEHSIIFDPNEDSEFMLVSLSIDSDNTQFNALN